MSEERPSQADTRAETGAAQAPGSSTPQRIIESYRLLRLLGSGGMGEVWLAEQHGELRRNVALKLIRGGRDSAHAVARFEAERQTLARMDHPNIARVFDAGTTAEGQPYFVMEFVDGLPIVQYCDSRHLSTRERVRLLRQVCDGVRHAHLKGILHRDLKPTNVLVEEVDGEPVPKIIDFGIAKAFHGAAADITPNTEFGMLLGTPEYMSPEQASGDPSDPDTRSDVYSLGVMLYELVCGELPIESARLRAGGPMEMRHLICHHEPPPPSQMWKQRGANRHEPLRTRGATSRTVWREINGDLDWIVMRAIEKEPSRRYPTASELSADLGRHLRDEPVEAGPPSLAYRLTKLVRRRRGELSIGLLVVVSLLMAGAWAWNTRRQHREVELARHEAERSRALAEIEQERGRVWTDAAHQELFDREVRNILAGKATLAEQAEFLRALLDVTIEGRRVQVSGAPRLRLSHVRRIWGTEKLFLVVTPRLRVDGIPVEAKRFVIGFDPALSPEQVRSLPLRSTSEGTHELHGFLELQAVRWAGTEGLEPKVNDLLRFAVGAPVSLALAPFFWTSVDTLPASYPLQAPSARASATMARLLEFSHAVVRTEDAGPVLELGLRVYPGELPRPVAFEWSVRKPGAARWIRIAGAEVQPDGRLEIIYTGRLVRRGSDGIYRVDLPGSEFAGAGELEVRVAADRDFILAYTNLEACVPFEIHKRFRLNSSSDMY